MANMLKMGESVAFTLDFTLCIYRNYTNIRNMLAKSLMIKLPSMLEDFEVATLLSSVLQMLQIDNY